MADEKKSRGWLVLVAAVLVVVGGIWALGAGSGEDDGGDRPGSAAVYADIETTTSCPELQATFDRNMDDAETRGAGDPLYDTLVSYADAANDRLSALDC